MSVRQSYSYNIAAGVATATGARVTPFGIYNVRLAATADVYVNIGPAPTATVANGMLIRASTSGECFKIAAGDQIAAITPTGTATLNVTELTQ